MTSPTEASSGSVWRNGDFVRLWSAGTISIFGSLITRTALPFAAILVLKAGPLEIAVRAGRAGRGADRRAGRGGWVDRLRRRPIMIWTDLGRALLLGSIPLAVLGLLGLPSLIVVAFAAAILSTFFDVADRSYLPRSSRRDGPSPRTAR